MPKVVLNIFKTEEGKYHMVMQAGENPEPKSLGTIVYSDGEEIDSKDPREVIRQLKEKVKNWACEQGIDFIENLDINPYD
jgi:predicted peroxiredoxin